MKPLLVTVAKENRFDSKTVNLARVLASEVDRLKSYLETLHKDKLVSQEVILLDYSFHSVSVEVKRLNGDCYFNTIETMNQNTISSGKIKDGFKERILRGLLNYVKS